MARRRKAFTLVELLVVITIIGMLMALLMPAVQQARESGRQATCMNNLKQVTTALLQYEGRHQRFPGYMESLYIDPQEGSLNVSWIISIMEDLGRPDVARLWRSREIQGQPAPPSAKVNDQGNSLGLRVFMKVLNCPSDVDTNKGEGSPSLSYVINCGLVSGQGLDGPFAGVASNQAKQVDLQNGAQATGENWYCSVDYISQYDGTSYTVIASERAGDIKWDRCSVNTFGMAAEAEIGFLWDPQDRQRQTPLINDLDNLDKTTDPNFARPTSYHPGIVLMSFAGGEVRKVTETIDPLTYIHIMTPNSKLAGEKLGIPELQKPFDPSKL